MRRIWMALALFSCADEIEAPPEADLDCDGTSDTQVMVMRALTFARASPDGVSEGGVPPENWSKRNESRALRLMWSTDLASVKPVAPTSPQSGRMLPRRRAR